MNLKRNVLLRNAHLDQKHHPRQLVDVQWLIVLLIVGVAEGFERIEEEYFHDGFCESSCWLLHQGREAREQRTGNFEFDKNVIGYDFFNLKNYIFMLFKINFNINTYL